MMICGQVVWKVKLANLVDSVTAATRVSLIDHSLLLLLKNPFVFFVCPTDGDSACIESLSSLGGAFDNLLNMFRLVFLIGDGGGLGLERPSDLL